jgi:hypothetical protein
MEGRHFSRRPAHQGSDIGIAAAEAGLSFFLQLAGLRLRFGLAGKAQSPADEGRAE